jgi:predicted deacylase
MDRRVAVEAFHPHELQFFTYGNAGAGPRVLITAGVHGGEATGIYAARRLMGWLEGRQLKGQVTVLPVANPAAFRRATRTGPYDELDMNRIFPGRPDGSPTLATAHTIWEEAKQSDYIVDLHCCGLFGSDYTLALWQEFPAARDLSAKLDIPVVIESGGTRNQLFVEASHAGIPAVIIELAGGQMGRDGGIIHRDSGERAFTAVSNLLLRLGVVAGEVAAAAPTFFGKLQEIETARAGHWVPAVAPGARVTEGQVLGHLDGEPVTVSFNGVATSVQPERYVFPGQMLANVAPVAAIPG